MSERTYGGLTAAQLAALEQAATPGPWFEQYEYDGSRTVCQMRSCDTTFCVNRAAHVEGNPYERTKENGRLVSAARNALPEMLARIAELEAAAATAFVDGAKWWHFRETGATMWQSDQQAACEEAARLRLGEYQKWWWTLQEQAARIAQLEAGDKQAHQLCCELAAKIGKQQSHIAELEYALEGKQQQWKAASSLLENEREHIAELEAQLKEARKDTARLVAAGLNILQRIQVPPGVRYEEDCAAVQDLRAAINAATEGR